jgi:hypothetical protein
LKQKSKTSSIKSGRREDTFEQYKQKSILHFSKSPKIRLNIGIQLGARITNPNDFLDVYSFGMMHKNCLWLDEKGRPDERRMLGRAGSNVDQISGDLPGLLC